MASSGGTQPKILIIFFGDASLSSSLWDHSLKQFEGSLLIVEIVLPSFMRSSSFVLVLL